jgi:hypothetical protein
MSCRRHPIDLDIRNAAEHEIAASRQDARFPSIGFKYRIAMIRPMPDIGERERYGISRADPGSRVVFRPMLTVPRSLQPGQRPQPNGADRGRHPSSEANQ